VILVTQARKVLWDHKDRVASLDRKVPTDKLVKLSDFPLFFFCFLFCFFVLFCFFHDKYNEQRTTRQV